MPAAFGPRIRVIALIGAMLTLVGMRPLPGASASSADPLPKTMLWAWERAADLRDVASGTGVAFLAQTITVDRDRLAIQSRRWSLKVKPDAVLSAVTRIEMPVTRVLTDSDANRIAVAIAATASYPQVAAVQIDFDATESQRDLYRRLITDVRLRLNRGFPLSITALASWCVGDRWLDGLPIDEAVPMLFDMGPLNEPFRRVALDRSAAHPLCRSSIGVSLDEPRRVLAGGRRVYIFNPGAWTPDAIELTRHPAPWMRGE